MGSIPKLIREQLSRDHGIRLHGDAQSVSGGSINRAFRVHADRGPLFLKVNAPSALRMFEAEAVGLEALGRARAVRVPAVLACGAVTDAAFLLLEWIDFGPRSDAAERRLGRDLASQHRLTRPTFGWDRDNTIGSTPQINTPFGDWQAFFGENRLRYQLDLAIRNGLPSATAVALESLLDEAAWLFDGHEPEASLLHGDLWAGNWAPAMNGTPVIFDPAVYYGDRETDLAMTRLFGGFTSAFYGAYEEAWPLARGWERRLEYYNLYHLMNHFNLFGTGYLASIQKALEKLRRDRA